MGLKGEAASSADLLAQPNVVSLQSESVKLQRAKVVVRKSLRYSLLSFCVVSSHCLIALWSTRTSANNAVQTDSCLSSLQHAPLIGSKWGSWQVSIEVAMSNHGFAKAIDALYKSVLLRESARRLCRVRSKSRVPGVRFVHCDSAISGRAGHVQNV